MPTEQPEGNIRDLKDFKDIQRAYCKAILLSLVALGFHWKPGFLFSSWLLKHDKSKSIAAGVVGVAWGLAKAAPQTAMQR